MSLIINITVDFLNKPEPPSLSTKDRQMNILSEIDPLTESSDTRFPKSYPLRKMKDLVKTETTGSADEAVSHFLPLYAAAGTIINKIFI